MRIRTASPILLVVLIALAAGTATAQEDEPTTLRIFDVSALVTPVRDAELEEFGLARPDWVGSVEFEGEEDPRRPIGGDELVEILRNCTGEESWERGDVTIRTLKSGRLLVRQTPGVLARIATQIAWLDRVLRRRVDVDVHWLTFGARSLKRLRSTGLLEALDRGSLEDREVGQLLAEALQPGNAHESGSSSSTLGRRVAIRRTTFVSYLQDYQVEIAQAAQIGHPIVAVDKEGLEVYVRPRPLLDGRRIAVDVLARAGRFQTPMPVIQTEAEELGTLDLPRFETVNLGTSAILRNGRTMAAVIRAPLGNRPPRLAVLLVTPTPTAFEAKRPEGMPVFFDCGFMASASRQFLIGWGTDLETRRGVCPALYPIDEPTVPFQVDALVDLIRESVDPDSWDALEEAWIESKAHGRILIRNHEETIARARRVAESAEAVFARALRIDARIYSVPCETLLDAGPILAPGLRPDAAVLGRLAKMDGAREVRGLTLNAITGTWACGQAGLTRNYLLSYDVEVAQEARISDPIGGQVFAGLLVNVRPVLSLDGEEVKMRVGLRLASVEETSVQEPRRTGSAMNGVLHHPRERTMRFNGTVTFPRGGCRILDGGADLEEEGRRLLIVLGAR